MRLEVVLISRRIHIFLPSDNFEVSVIDVVLRLIRLIVGVVDVIASSETLEGEEGKEINLSCSSHHHILQR